jgi:cobalt-zinc-cadmium efflux system protein
MISAWLLHRGQSHDLNMRGAYLHVLGDMLGSIGAVTASVLIMAFNWTFADTLVSLLIAILIIFNAVRLVMESVNILLEGSPAHINVDAVRNHLKTLEGVIAVHDLHVWTITSDRHAVSMHVVVDVKDYNPNMVEMLCNELEHKFGLCHVTIQLETEAFAIHDVHC